MTRARLALLLVALAVGPAASPSAVAESRRADRGPAASTDAEPVATVELIKAGVERLLPAELAVASVALPAGLPATLDPAALTIEYPRAARPGPGVAQLTVRAGAARPRTLWARVVLGTRGPIAIARRDLPTGATVGDDDVEVALGAVADRDPIDPAALIGLRLARPIVAGAALVTADVVVPAPLARGTAVTVIVRRGAVAITAPARLERAARIGESTAARLTANGKVIDGRLGPRNTLVVEDLR